MTALDPATPTWVRHAAVDAVHQTDNLLINEMLKHGEECDDNTLWQLRRSQYRKMISAVFAEAEAAAEPPRCRTCGGLEQASIHSRVRRPSLRNHDFKPYPKTKETP